MLEKYLLFYMPILSKMGSKNISYPNFSDVLTQQLFITFYKVYNSRGNEKGVIQFVVGIKNTE